MSNVNIKRAVENMRANSTVYAPVVEMIVNGIQAIDETGRKDGKVLVRAQRSSQVEPDGSLQEVVGFDIEDNGIGKLYVEVISWHKVLKDAKMRDPNFFQ